MSNPASASFSTIARPTRFAPPVTNATLALIAPYYTFWIFKLTRPAVVRHVFRLNQLLIVEFDWGEKEPAFMLNQPYDNFDLRNWLMPHVRTRIAVSEIISPRGREAVYR